MHYCQQYWHCACALNFFYEICCTPRRDTTVFEKCPTQPQFASSGCRSYGIHVSKHCCFYCLLANKTPKLAMDAGYCLVRIESFLSSVRNEVYFSAIYFLDTCLKVNMYLDIVMLFSPIHYRAWKSNFQLKKDIDSLTMVTLSLIVVVAIV